MILKSWFVSSLAENLRALLHKKDPKTLLLQQ